MVLQQSWHKILQALAMKFSRSEFTKYYLMRTCAFTAE